MADSDLTQAHFADLCRRAERMDAPQFSRFLDPAQRAIAYDTARKSGACCVFWGGYDDAERVIAMFSQDDTPFCGDIRPIALRWNPKFAGATHRDVLGALMHLGLSREHYGDILVENDRAIVFVTAEGALVAQGIDSVGSAAVCVQLLKTGFDLPPPRGLEFRDTVPSLRLDAVIASAFKLSRSSAQDVIARGLVKLKHVPCEHSDIKVSEGDILSLRGEGRAKLLLVNGPTKKGRLSITLFRYL